LGNFIEAKEYYNKLLEFNSEDTTILISLGDISNKLYDFHDAEQFLVEALSCGEKNENILFELGIAYGGQKKYLQSAQAFKEAIKYSDDKNPILHFQLGVVYQELLLHDLAIKEFEKFLEENSNDSMVNAMIAASYQKLSKFKEAIDYYEKTLNNQNANLLNNYFQIGSCYANLNQNNNAAKYFKRTLKINPDFAPSRFQLINVYQLLNKNKEAKKECDILFMLDRSLYNTSNFCTNL
jgi:tetratricopeptide (TPR) repeat protein